MNVRFGFFAKLALIAAFIPASAFIAHAQQPSTEPSAAPSPSAAPAAAQPVDPKTHEAALHFAAALGIREKMATTIDPSLDKAVAEMKEKFPNLRPEFFEEFRRRMKERMSLDAFVGIFVSVYENHFNADELNELSNAVTVAAQGKTPTLSDALKEKFQQTAPDVQSEIIGRMTQLGARIGAEVGGEIQKEHPDWAPAPNTAKPAADPK